MKLLLLLSLIGANALVYTALADRGRSITFFDVGQGDGALIRDGNREILVDAGPDNKILAELGKAMPPLDRTIEAIVVTHPHRDHYNGFNFVLERYAIGLALVSNEPEESAAYDSLLRKLKEKNIPIYKPLAGQTVAVGAQRLKILSPFKNTPGEIAFRLEGPKRVLFSADLYKPAERLVLAAFADLQADILKVPHHGSKYAALPAFVRAVNPADAVVSAGKNNRYGHPHTETLEVLAGRVVRRTDTEGTIRYTF